MNPFRLPRILVPLLFPVLPVTRLSAEAFRLADVFGDHMILLSRSPLSMKSSLSLHRLRFFTRMIRGSGLFVAAWMLALAASPVRAQSGNTSVIDAGNGFTLRLSAPAPYVTHPDGSISIQYKSGLAVTEVTPASTGEGKDARNGAMWEPYAGRGYYDGGAWGFDGRQAKPRTDPNYDADFNVAPGATGKPFVVPGEGSLVLAFSREEELGIDYQAQRSPAGQVIRRYKVVNFVNELPPEGSFRAPTRGPKNHYPNWTVERMQSRLDTVFPRKLDLSSAHGLGNEADIDRLIGRMETLAAQGTFAAVWSSEPLAASEGVVFYGAGWSLDVGRAILALMGTTIDPDRRNRLALAVTQIGIDLAGIVRDGGYWQCNGGHTHGRIMAVLAAGLLLEDEYFVAMVNDPLGRDIAPGQRLKVYPFSEQRTLVKVTLEPRTEGTNPSGSDQRATWGNVVGTGSSSPIAPEWLGYYIWNISPDRAVSYPKGNSMHPNRGYWHINARWHVLVTAILGNLEPGTVDLTPLEGMKTSGAQLIYNHREYADGPAPVRGNLRAGYESFVKYIGEENLWKGPPAMAMAPYVTIEGALLSAKPHGWQPDHGSPITGHDLRFRLNVGEWKTLEDYQIGATVPHAGTEGDNIEVQIRAKNAIGPGPWSSNQTGTVVPDPENPDAPKPVRGKPVATFTL